MKLIAVVSLLLALALPAAADIGHDITLPIVGNVFLPNVTYRTELVLRNHRDVPQQVVIEYIGGPEQPGGFMPYDGLVALDARGTHFYKQGLIPNTNGTFIRAMRLWAVKATGQTDAGGQALFTPDPDARIEAMAYVVGDRGRFGYLGSSRQEIQATASTEYHAREAIFHGITHEAGIYTNIGITNMDETRSVTFFVEFPGLQPIEVHVPPRSMRSIRLPGDGGLARQLRIYPDWANNGGAPTPWVAYTSSVDTLTGDAWTGVRSLASIQLEP